MVSGLTGFVVGVVVGLVLYHLALVWLLRHRRRWEPPPTTRAVIRDPCSLIEPGSLLWYLLGCYW